MTEIESIDHQLATAVAKRQAARADHQRAVRNAHAAEQAKLHARKGIHEQTAEIDRLLDQRATASLAELAERLVRQ